jgi:hypothetical protein
VSRLKKLYPFFFFGTFHLTVNYILLLGEGMDFSLQMSTAHSAVSGEDRRSNMGGIESFYGNRPSENGSGNSF